MSSSLLQRERAAIARLMRSPAIAAGDVTRALREVTEAAASLLDVARASVWRFDDKRSRIELLDLFEATKGEHSAGIKLFASDAPTYFAAMAGERVIAAHDARTDPRTKEFAIGYLLPLGITSMLDAPVLLHGKVTGVVCLEHVGPQRRWEPAEELVVGSLADFVGIALAAAAHAEQSRDLREMLRLFLDAASVPLVVAGVDDGIVKLANAAAGDVVGKRLADLAKDPASLPASLANARAIELDGARVAIVGIPQVVGGG